jgi:hypothetical protein
MWKKNLNADSSKLNFPRNQTDINQKPASVQQNVNTEKALIQLRTRFT